MAISNQIGFQQNYHLMQPYGCERFYTPKGSGSRVYTHIDRSIRVQEKPLGYIIGEFLLYAAQKIDSIISRFIPSFPGASARSNLFLSKNGNCCSEKEELQLKNKVLNGVVTECRKFKLEKMKETPMNESFRKVIEENNRLKKENRLFIGAIQGWRKAESDSRNQTQQCRDEKLVLEKRIKTSRQNYSIKQKIDTVNVTLEEKALILNKNHKKPSGNKTSNYKLYAFFVTTFLLISSFMNFFFIKKLFFKHEEKNPSYSLLNSQSQLNETVV